MSDELNKKKVDEEWKRRAQEEKDRLKHAGPGDKPRIEVPPGVRRDPPKEERAAPTQANDDSESQGRYPEATFDTFVAGLAAQTLVALGQMEHPHTREREFDLDQARYTIDTLVMLRRKTKGNLTREEDERLESMLAELQMLFVRVTQSVDGGKGTV